MEMTIFQINKAIYNGEMDEHLDSLERNIRQRRYRMLRVGTSVKFNEKCRPQYLIGVTGKITGAKTKNYVVTIDEGQYIGRFGRIITVPPDLLTVVE